MKKISKLDIDESVHIKNSLSSYYFEKCKFSHVRIGSSLKRLEDKLNFSDITISDCKVVDASIDAVDFKNIQIHNLSTKKNIDICNALFENCTLRGKIGSILIIDSANYSGTNPQFDLEVLNYNNSAYSKMDWALDISNADFTLFDCRSIPAEKIIINKHSQIAVNLKRMKALTKFPNDDIKLLWEVCTKTINRDFTGYNYILTTSQRTKRHEEELRYFEFIRENGCELKRCE